MKKPSYEVLQVLNSRLIEALQGLLDPEMDNDESFKLAYEVLEEVDAQYT